MHEPTQPPCGDRAAPHRWAAVVLALVYMGTIFALSHTPHPPIPALFRGWSDKVLHALLYAPLAVLWGLVFRGPPRHRALLGWAVAGLFGLTDELHQGFVPAREASLWDWAADLLGAAGGAAALAWALTRRGRARRTDDHP